MLILLFWGGEHDKPSGIAHNSGIRSSTMHFLISSIIFMGLLFSSPLLIFLYILFWVGEHGKPSGAICNSGTRCSCAHFNFIIVGSLFSLPLHFFLVLLVFGSGFFWGHE